MKKIFSIKKENRILLIGCGVSITIIVILFIIRTNMKDWLDIKMKWIGIAILHLLLAPFVKGLILYGFNYQVNVYEQVKFYKRLIE